MTEPVPTVDGPPDPVASSVPAATKSATERPKKGASGTTPPSMPISVETPPSDANGSIPGSSESESASQTFSSSEPPSSDWTLPRNVREFAAQTNTVATMVLKGEIDLERARVYSGLARTVAQAMSTEVSRARFLAQEPDLSLEKE